MKTIHCNTKEEFWSSIIDTPKSTTKISTDGKVYKIYFANGKNDNTYTFQTPIFKTVTIDKYKSKLSSSSADDLMIRFNEKIHDFLYYFCKDMKEEYKKALTQSQHYPKTYEEKYLSGKDFKGYEKDTYDIITKETKIIISTFCDIHQKDAKVLVKSILNLPELNEIPNMYFKTALLKIILELNFLNEIQIEKE